MPQAAGAGLAAWLGAAEGTAYYAAAYAVGYAATAAAISYAAQELLAPSANKVANTQSRALGQSVSNAQGVIGGGATSTSVRQSAAPRRLIFGRVKTGGVVVYFKKTPDEYDLHYAIYIGEGPIQGITGLVYLGDKTSDDYPGLVSTEVYQGVTSPGRSTALEAVSEGEWTANHLGRGCAWVKTRYVFEKDVWDIGPVLPAFEVLGLLCYDPRTETTPGAASSNPALAMLYFIRSEYGYAAPDEWIDFDSFAAAASVCDEIIDSADPANVVLGVPNNIRRYSINGAFEVDASPAATVQAIEDTCCGRLVFTGGKYRFYAGAWRAPTGPSLTAEYLRAAPVFRPHPSRSQRFNVARGTYTEPLQDWKETSIHEQILSSAVIAEDGEIVQSVSLPAVTNSAQAQRIARLKMNLARSAVPMILQCNYAAFQWRLYDVLTLDLPEVGASGAWLITGYKYLDPSEGGGIDMTLVPHKASDFVWDHTTMEQLVEEVVAPNMDFPVPGITGLSQLVGTAFYNGSDQVDRTVTFVWDDLLPSWAILAYYEVQVKEGAGEWTTYQAAESRWVISASPDLTYEFRVRPVGLNDKYGAWVSSSVSVYRDTSTAGAGTSITVTSGAGHTIAWTNPSDDNFSRMRLLTVSGPGLGSPNVIATLPGRPGTPQSITTAYPAGTHYALQSETVDGEGGTIVYAGEGTTDTSALLAEQLDPINTTLTDLEDRIVTLESA